VQQPDGTVKNVMFNAGTQIMHLPVCPARQQNQVQAPVQQQFAPQQQTINPFAPAPVAAPQQQQPAEQDGPDSNEEVVEALTAINTTLTNGLLAIFKELRPDNNDSMLATIAQNLGTLINLQKPAAMIGDDPADDPTLATPAVAPPAPENPFEAPKKEKGKK
jgi:hypothetical protein